MQNPQCRQVGLVFNQGETLPLPNFANCYTAL